MEQSWYAIYTKTYHEKKLFDSICQLNNESDFACEAYLPTIVEETQWSDRKKKKTVPLFRNYLFVKHSDDGFDKIKRLPGFYYYVRFEVFPAVVRQEQIDMIKNVLENNKVTTCSSKLLQGERVRICQGPMSDYEGALIEDQGNNKVAIEVKHFNQCLLVSVALDNIIRI